MMTRTQISLSPLEYELAKKVSKQKGISLAELFRRALRSQLPPPQSNKPWMDFAGMVQSGDAYSSQKIDDLLYGIKG